MAAMDNDPKHTLKSTSQPKEVQDMAPLVSRPQHRWEYVDDLRRAEHERLWNLTELEILQLQMVKNPWENNRDSWLQPIMNTSSDSDEKELLDTRYAGWLNEEEFPLGDEQRYISSVSLLKM